MPGSPGAPLSGLDVQLARRPVGVQGQCARRGVTDTTTEPGGRRRSRSRSWPRPSSTVIVEDQDVGAGEQLAHPRPLRSRRAQRAVGEVAETAARPRRRGRSRQALRQRPRGARAEPSARDHIGAAVARTSWRSTPAMPDDASITRMCQLRSASMPFLVGHPAPGRYGRRSTRVGGAGSSSRVRAAQAAGSVSGCRAALDPALVLAKRPAAHVRDHQPPGRRQDDAHREVPAVRRWRCRQAARSKAARRTPQRDVGLDGARAPARHLDQLDRCCSSRTATTSMNLLDTPGHQRLLRGHVPRARRRRRRS